MTTPTGADEHRARALLIRALDGPAATPPRPAPPAPPARPDWWERLYDEQPPAAKPPAPPARTAPTKPGWEDAPGSDEATPRAARRNRRHPVRRVQTELAGLEKRAQWLISTSAGAGLGWALGLQHLFSGWITTCGHDTTPGTGVILGVGLVAACSYAAHATRRYWPPLAWACRIPASTALLALALYAPGAAQ